MTTKETFGYEEAKNLEEATFISYGLIKDFFLLYENRVYALRVEDSEYTLLNGWHDPSEEQRSMERLYGGLG